MSLQTYELEDGSVEVILGDFPFIPPWRAVMSRARVLRANERGTVGLGQAKLERSINQLCEVDGYFRPGYGNDKQLVLEVLT